MLIARRVEHLGHGGTVEGDRIVRIEGHGSRLDARIEIDAEVHLAGDLRREIGIDGDFDGRRNGIDGAVGIGGEIRQIAGKAQARAGNQARQTVLFEGEAKLAVARVADLAGLRVVKAEETLAVDCHVERVVGDFHPPLLEILEHVVGADAGAGGRICRPAALSCRRHVGEAGNRRLETDGLRVGNVVADDVEGFSCRDQAAQAVRKGHFSILRGNSFKPTTARDMPRISGSPESALQPCRWRPRWRPSATASRTGAPARSC